MSVRGADVQADLERSVVSRAAIGSVRNGNGRISRWIWVPPATAAALYALGGSLYLLGGRPAPMSSPAHVAVAVVPDAATVAARVRGSTGLCRRGSDVRRRSVAGRDRRHARLRAPFSCE